MAIDRQSSKPLVLVHLKNNKFRLSSALEYVGFIFFLKKYIACILANSYNKLVIITGNFMNFSLFLLFIFSLSSGLHAMWFVNRTDEARVIFVVTLRSLENINIQIVELPAMSRKSRLLSDIQQVGFNEFGVSVKTSKGEIDCLPSFNRGAANNYNATLQTDDSTKKLQCIIRVNPPGGIKPS